MNTKIGRIFTFLIEKKTQKYFAFICYILFIVMLSGTISSANYILYFSCVYYNILVYRLYLRNAWKKYRKTREEHN